MPDPLFCLVAHPLAVVAHVLSQPLRPMPRSGNDRRLVPRCQVHRRPAGEIRRDLDHRLVDQHRHRIKVAGVGFKTQPLRFERQRSAAGERIVECGQGMAVEDLPGARMVRVLGTGAPPAMPDLASRLFQNLLVGGVLPEDQFSEDLEQALAFTLRRHVTERLPISRPVAPRDVPAICCRRFARRRRVLCPALLQRPLRCALLPGVRQQDVDVIRRVVDHLGKNDRPRRSQRTARPPQMQCRRMAVPDRLLPRRCCVDCVERQRHLDQLS